MKRRITALFVGLLCIGLGTASAHALWIETSAQGKKGTSQDVKIYFGEFGTDDISQATEWFSDLKDFNLILITPDKQEINLPVKAAGDAYQASFIPKMEGTYHLAVRKVVKDVYYGFKLNYNATAAVQIGEAASGLSAPNPMAIIPVSGDYRVGKVIRLRTDSDTALKGEKTLTVVSPNTWTKRLYPDKDSRAEFTPLWPGKYLVEMVVKEETGGTHNGKAYQTDFHCATFIYEII